MSNHSQSHLRYLLLPVNCQQLQQYFKLRPQATVEVVEGANVILQCVVGNQAGSVQWSHDGIVLGEWRDSETGTLSSREAREGELSELKTKTLKREKLYL